MQKAANRDEHLFQPTPGARAVFSVLSTAGWQSAIATGGWEETARLKLARAGIDINGIPAAFAEDAHPREDLIRLARMRAEAATGEAFDRVIYVGDGPWDVRAAAVMSIGFVGIASGERKAWLEESGARRVLADFSDETAFLAAIAAP